MKWSSKIICSVEVIFLILIEIVDLKGFFLIHKKEYYEYENLLKNVNSTIRVVGNITFYTRIKFKYFLINN